jgi:hypothetical protein
LRRAPGGFLSGGNDVKSVQTNNRASPSTANILFLLERVAAPCVSVILGGAVVRETLERGIISGAWIGGPEIRAVRVARQ